VFEGQGFFKILEKYVPRATLAQSR
jgi:hypothetical protein